MSGNISCSCSSVNGGKPRSGCSFGKPADAGEKTAGRGVWCWDYAVELVARLLGEQIRRG